MKLKKILGISFSVLILGSTLSGCKIVPSSIASSSIDLVDTNTENVLNVFNWSEYLPESVVKDFEDKFNVNVNYMTYSSNEEMLAKIMAGDEVFDISVASDYMVDVMRKQKLMEEINMKNLENFKNIGDQFKNLSFDPGNKYSIPYMWGTAVIAVNSKKVPITVTSYSDLWDSSLKSSLVVLDDQRALIGVALKKLGYSINETDPVKLEQAKKELLKLKANIKTFDSDSPKTELINGTAAAGYLWGAEAALAQKENKDIKIIFPKEGMYLWQDNFIIPKGANHKKNAETFINFLLDPNVSAKISKEFPYANPNVAAHQYIDKNILNNTTVYPTDNDLKMAERIKDLGDSAKLYDKIWSEIKAK